MKREATKEVAEEDYRLKRFFEILLEADLKVLHELLEKKEDE